MRKTLRGLLLGTAGLTIATQAHATTVDFFAHAGAPNFVVPASGVLDRSLDVTGSLTYTSGLADNTYNDSVLSAFTLNFRRSVVLAAVPGVTQTADYSFTQADLSNFSLTITGGQPTGATFDLAAKKPYAYSLPGFATLYAAIQFDDGYDFYLGDSPTNLTLVAHDGTSGSSIRAAVPEPATWALMALGFGAIGATMRRRTARKVAVRVAYA